MNLTSRSQRRWCVSLLLSMILPGCVTTSPHKVAEAQASPSEFDPAASRTVQAIGLQSTGVDGQTSWIIEPDVPRIPKVAGLNADLPPHIERRLSYAFDLAQRGASYSAGAEFRSVLCLCALELDAREGGGNRREALRRGFVALDEADEFSGDQIDWREAADVRLAALGHVTPVLNQGAQPPVDSITAVQAYYEFAEDRLAYACDGLPGASLAFYGLGRTLAVDGTHVAHVAGKAALMQRIALRLAPQNVLAGNELGVLLARHGHLDEAEKLFQQCVATNASPETWQNLAIVYARNGDQAASRAAAAESELLAAGERRAGPQPNPAAIAADAPTAPGKTNDATGKPVPGTKSSMFAQLPEVFRR